MDGFELRILDLSGGSALAAGLPAALAAWGRVEVLEGPALPAAEPEAGEAAARWAAGVAGQECELLVVAPACAAAGLKPVVAALVARSPRRAVLVAGEASAPDDLLELLQAGASDVLTPPLGAVEIAARLERLAATRRGMDEPVERLKQRLGLAHLIGSSPAFRAAVERIPLMARCDATVLILGETGTGKDVCARAIHYLSSRAGRPFLAVNCGAIPLELIENELFGHERSAYTGAVSAQVGLIHEAEGGTLFLDEIDCLPAAAQVKLLRFLQDKEYRSLGSPRPRRADVRVVAATNTDVEQALASGRLRRDLYYRLAVLPLTLPPLRERRDDIPALCRHFLAQHAGDHDLPLPDLSPGALEALLRHDWPGNVRELEHALERALLLAEGEHRIEAAHLLLGAGSRAPGEPSPFRAAKARAVAAFERSYIEGLLLAHGGNITRAAEAARKNRRAFWELIRKHGIDVDRFRSGAAH